MHCGISEMLAWKHQCITSDLESSVECSIELVAGGQRSGKGLNKWKLILWCRGRGE